MPPHGPTATPTPAPGAMNAASTAIECGDANVIATRSRRAHPNETEPDATDAAIPAGNARLFRSRVQLLTSVQATPDLDPEAALAVALTTELHREVAAMNCENFIVRMQLEAVERFRQRESWERLTASDVEILQSQVAGLPSEIETDDIESRLFDLTALKMQLALAEGDTGTFEQHRQRVVEIAMLLEERSTIPAVAAQLAYLASVQESAFWEGIALDGLEGLGLRLRGLVPFLDRKTRTIVYTDFRDEIMCVWRMSRGILATQLYAAGSVVE